MSFKKIKKNMLTPAEQMQERTVIVAREDLLPIFDSQDIKLSDVKWLLENMAVVIESASYDAMAKMKISELSLRKNLRKEYPQYKNFKALLDTLDGRSVLDATNALKWLSEKVKKTVEDENKDRKYKDLMIKF